MNVKSGRVHRCSGILLSLLTTLFFLAAWQRVPAETLRLTLDEAIALGLKNSSNIQSKLIAVDSSRAGVRVARSGYYPEFWASANWAHLFEQTEISGSFLSASDPVTVMFDLTQPIYKFGRVKHGVQLATEGLNLAKMDLNEEERSLIVDIKRAFYGYMLAEQVASVQEETLAQREDALRLAQERYEAGLVPDFEVLSAESDVESFRPEVIAAHNQVELALLAVMDLLNITERSDDEVELIGELSPVFFRFDRDATVDQAINNNYDLRQYRSSINFALYQESLKKDEKKPIIGSFANYTLNSTFNTATGANDYKNWDDLLTVGVNVSIPLSALIPYSREYTGQSQASLELAELRTNLSTIENSITIGVDGLLLKIDEEEAKIKSSEKAVELASRLYDSAKERFASGLLTRIELKEAEVRLNSARVGYLTSVFNYMNALFDLMDIVGLHEFDADIRRYS